MSDDFSCNSFRANVHHHTVLRPGEIILCPPAYLLSLYVQAVERQNSKDSTMECSYDLENCLSTNKNGFSRATRYGSAVAATDCPPIVREAGKDFSKSIQRWPAYSLANIVRMIRNFDKSTAVCNLFFFALGRPMEISYRQHLFPLPETLDELYRIAATHGSIPSSVSALPIVVDKNSTILKCTDVSCLRRSSRRSVSPDVADRECLHRLWLFIPSVKYFDTPWKHTTTYLDATEILPLNPIMRIMRIVQILFPI